MGEKQKYEQQQKLSFMQFLAEMPNFIALGISGFMTGSMLVWMDFIESLGNVLRTGAVTLLSKRLSKDLRYEYNYGVSKIENIAVLFCDGIIVCGLLVAVLLSVQDLISPQRPSDYLIFVVFLKIANVILDLFFLCGQYKIYKIDRGMFTKSNYTATLGILLLDATELCSIFLVWAFKNHTWTWYFTPILSLLIAAYLGYKCVDRIKKAISELVDRTLSEDEQVKILKVIARHFNEYSEFYFVKSHKLGDKAQIELVLSFPPETTYQEIIELKTALQEELSELITDSTINILIM